MAAPPLVVAIGLDEKREMAAPPLVVAIGLGTAFSGYAYSYQHSPEDVQVNESWAKNLVSFKTETSVLVDPDMKFKAFGYEAETMYSSLLEEEEVEGWALFRKFKLKIYDTEFISDKTELTDVSTKVKLPALKVFAMAIKFLKDHAIEALQKEVPDEDILFVVTVPAIWSERARRFMREAAIEAGLASDRLVLALEPEAASAWCQNIPLIDGPSLNNPGTKFMVADLGGGTADITVYQVMRNNKLKELHEATGGKWGGIEVDNQFIAVLTEVLGKETMQRFAKECLYDFFCLLREFEVTKRKISSSMTDKISIKLPTSLIEINMDTMMASRPDYFETVMTSSFGEKLTISGDTLRIDAEIARDMYKYCIDGLVTHIGSHECFTDVDIILCVGGFSECEVIQRALIDAFPEKKLAFPQDGGLAVLKGAVLSGHQPGIIATRKAKFTYGISIVEDFDEDNPKHILKQKRMIDYKPMCVDIFKKLVTVGQEITSGYTIVENEVLPESEDEMNAVCSVYLSRDEDPQYVTDPMCSLLGTFQVCLPFEKEMADRAYERSLVFGDTEIMIIVKHLKSGQMFRKYFNFP